MGVINVYEITGDEDDSVVDVEVEVDDETKERVTSRDTVSGLTKQRCGGSSP